MTSGLIVLCVLAYLIVAVLSYVPMRFLDRIVMSEYWTAEYVRSLIPLCMIWPEFLPVYVTMAACKKCSANPFRLMEKLFVRPILAKVSRENADKRI